MNRNIHSEKQRLDTLFDILNNIQEIEIQSHWSRYLCVLISVFIENSLKYLIYEYVRGRAHPNIMNYVENNIAHTTNLNEQKIQSLLGTFNSEWRINFVNEISDEQKAAIDSVVANRHNIVHGRDVNISPVRINEYYKKIVRVINIIEYNCIK